jgi:peptide/nickel transport system ATP-binding protein
MNPETAILKASSITKRYQMKGAGLASRGAILTAVDNVDIEIRPGETLGIAGESGCASQPWPGLWPACSSRKMALSAVTAGTSPHCHPPNMANSAADPDDLSGPVSSLNPRMRVGDIISEPLILSGMLSSSERRRRTESIMQTVGLSTEHYQRFPHEFSGGQRQRIGIARALAAARA